MHNTKVIISPEAYWFFCIGLLLLPLKVMAAWVISVLVHEVCHYLALNACGYTVSHVRFGAFGAKMNTGLLSTKSELISAASGPLGGFLLLIFIRVFPLLSIIAVLHSLFNLIPLYPLDGGRITYCLIDRYSKNTEKLKREFDIIVISILIIISLYGLFKLSFGILPLLTVILSAFRIKRKSACKLEYD